MSRTESETCNNDDGIQPPTRLKLIRLLNDWLRMHGSGGRIVMTSGIAALPDTVRAAVIEAVRQFDAFDERNDPHGEHDFALVPVEAGGVTEVMFKIEYFDLDLQNHSPDPADPDATRRVMTVMLPDEY